MTRSPAGEVYTRQNDEGINEERPAGRQETGIDLAIQVNPGFIDIRT